MGGCAVPIELWPLANPHGLERPCKYSQRDLKRMATPNDAGDRKNQKDAFPRCSRTQEAAPLPKVAASTPRFASSIESGLHRGPNPHVFKICIDDVFTKQLSHILRYSQCRYGNWATAEPHLKDASPYHTESSNWGAIPM